MGYGGVVGSSGGMLSRARQRAHGERQIAKRRTLLFIQFSEHLNAAAQTPLQEKDLSAVFCTILLKS